MAEKKSNWEDIPSLEGLEMDWDYSGEGAHAKRKFERLTLADMTSIFEVKDVPVRVAASGFSIDGSVNDISGGGIAVTLKKPLEVGQKVMVGFFMGSRKIVSRAVVRQAAPEPGGYRIGLQFEDIKEEDSRYINGLYASKVLKR
jgi:hypothetical protein